MIDEKDIDSLFDNIVKSEIIKKKVLSKHHQKEQKRLESIYSFSEDNIEDVFQSILEKPEIITETPFTKGKKYGLLEIIDNTMVRKNGRNWYKCRCQCGKEVLRRGDILLKPTVSGCIECSKIENLQRLKILKNNEAQIGQTFGKRTIIEILKSDNSKNKEWGLLVKCKCICGNIANIRYSRLKKGKRTACSQCTKPGPKSLKERILLAKKDKI